MGYDSISNAVASPAHNTFNVRPGLPLGDDTLAPRPAAKNGKGFSFADLIDVINPLQHVPVVSSIYRRITGDEMGNSARIAGGALFGGVIGLATSVADAIVDKATGSDIGDHVMTAMFGKDTKQPAETDIAAATPETPVKGPIEGKVEVIPQGHLRGLEQKISAIAPTSLDPATFNALADILGSSAPLEHLMPVTTLADPKREKTQSGAQAKQAANLPAAISYNDALSRMNHALDAYQTKKPDNAAVAR